MVKDEGQGNIGIRRGVKGGNCQKQRTTVRWKLGVHVRRGTGRFRVLLRLGVHIRRGTTRFRVLLRLGVHIRRGTARFRVLLLEVS